MLPTAVVSSTVSSCREPNNCLFLFCFVLQHIFSCHNRYVKQYYPPNNISSNYFPEYSSSGLSKAGVYFLNCSQCDSRLIHSISAYLFHNVPNSRCQRLIQKANSCKIAKSRPLCAELLWKASQLKEENLFAFGINAKVTGRCALWCRPTDHPQASAHQQNWECIMLFLTFASS